MELDIKKEHGQGENKKKNLIKYPEGSLVGVNKDILLVKRIKPINNRKGYLCSFECPFCHKIFYADLYSVIRQYKSCGCWRKEHNQFKKLDLTNKKFGKLTVIEDTGKRVTLKNKKEKVNVIWKCICECGSITEVSSSHLKSGHTTSCGKCCISKGEDKIKEILQSLNINFEQQKKFQKCRDKALLSFDFYLPDYNCCIEYDGEQHYHGWGRAVDSKESLKVIQRRDSIKNNFCANNDIKLIRIPYTDFNKINENYIQKKLGVGA